MVLKNRTQADMINNEIVGKLAKKLNEQDKKAASSNPKNQQGKTADGRKAGIVRRA